MASNTEVLILLARCSPSFGCHLDNAARVESPDELDASLAAFVTVLRMSREGWFKAPFSPSLFQCSRTPARPYPWRRGKA